MKYQEHLHLYKLYNDLVNSETFWNILLQVDINNSTMFKILKIILLLKNLKNTKQPWIPPYDI